MVPLLAFATGRWSTTYRSAIHSRSNVMPPDQAKLDAMMGKMLHDMGAAATGALVVIGDKLGLYKALAEAGPLTPVELATRTGTAERYVREWLQAQAAAGYVQYQADTGTYAMT